MVRYALARSNSPTPFSTVENQAITGGAEKYEIIDTLAHGSTADLLLAIRRGAIGINSLVVIKRLRMESGDDRRNFEKFLQEARVSVRLRHANIVHTFSVAEDGGVPYMAMEYLEGESLRDVLTACSNLRARLPVAVSVHIAQEALKGLHHAHTMPDYEGRPLGFVHRDVSPHNIFICYDGSVQLIDFGISKTTLAVEQTAEGIVKGKISYLSPEQALGQSLDARTDIFSLGITLWEMLTMRRLMAGSTPFEVMLRILNESSPRPSTMARGIPRVLDLVLERALDRDASGRFSTAEEMRLALKAPGCTPQGPLGSEELADVMGTLFRAQREQKQLAIAQKMSELEGSTTSILVPAPARPRAEPVRRQEDSIRFFEPAPSASRGFSERRSRRSSNAALKLDRTGTAFRISDWLADEKAAPTVPSTDDTMTSPFYPQSPAPSRVAAGTPGSPPSTSGTFPRPPSDDAPLSTEELRSVSSAVRTTRLLWATTAFFVLVSLAKLTGGAFATRLAERPFWRSLATNAPVTTTPVPHR